MQERFDLEEVKGSVLSEIIAALQRVRPGRKPVVISRKVPDMDSACKLTDTIAHGTQSGLRGMPKKRSYKFQCRIDADARDEVRVEVAVGCDDE